MCQQIYTSSDLRSCWSASLHINRCTRKTLFREKVWNSFRNCDPGKPLPISTGKKWFNASASTRVLNQNHGNTITTSKQHITKANNTIHNHLLSPKRILSIITWNVRTAKENSQLQIIGRETECFNCDFIGLA